MQGDYPYCCKKRLEHLKWDNERRNMLFGSVIIKYCPFCGHTFQAPVNLENFDFEDCVQVVLGRCKRFNSNNVYDHVAYYLKRHNYEATNNSIIEVHNIILKIMAQK